MNLFDLLPPPEPPKFIADWRPEAPPSLDGVHELELDCETTGLRWWPSPRPDRPVGMGIHYGGRTRYLPWAHKGGGNLDEAVVKRWAQRELRNKKIVNLNTRFDIHMLREWGVDLEAQGCTFGDVGHQAALLDDHRQEFNLAALVEAYLQEEKKVTIVNGIVLNPARMAEYHAGIVAARAEGDVRQVYKLKQVFRPMLEQENLLKVLALEEEVIPVVCEMEKNGTLIDVELLERWLKEVDEEVNRLLMEIYRETSLRINPNKDMGKLFEYFKIPNKERTAGDRPSYTKEVLNTVTHPTVKKAVRAKKLLGLKSKYLLPYQRSLALGDGKTLRYALHQLRSKKDEFDDNPYAKGTVSGRFSSTAVIKDHSELENEGVNIQQIRKTAKQIAAMAGSSDFLVRVLHVPEAGYDWLSADAEQIEYRLFAHHANNSRVIQAYRDHPGEIPCPPDDVERMSFHKFMHGMIKPFRPDFTYGQQKDLNFAVIYAAGVVKMGLMLGYITKSEFDALYRRAGAWKDPKLKPVLDIKKIYDREVPEAKKLLEFASHLAKNECDEYCERDQFGFHEKYEHRGYVTTIEGRRSRFRNNQRLHKALNAVIQGTAADIMKRKLVELHKARAYTGLKLRFTVHDEVNGDVRDKEQARRVAEILDHQSYPDLRVPIWWSVGLGKNWKEAGE